MSKNPYLQAGIFLALLFSAVAMVVGGYSGHRGQHDHHRSPYGAGHAASLVYENPVSVTVGLPAVTSANDFEIPTWPGCQQDDYEDRLDCTRDKYVAFLKAHLRAPQGRNGRVAALFTVDLAGQMQEAELYEETDPFLAAEVMRLVGLMQGADVRWTPGKVRGTPRALQMGLVVSFGQRCRNCADVDVEMKIMK